MTKKYFKGLNSLRFVAAFIVILTHIELLKLWNGMDNLLDVPFFNRTGGHLGVILFFVLSGFLITYLLLKEFEAKNKINILKFYGRRILRIWPIYYLTVIFCVFILPILNDFFGFTFQAYSFNQVVYYFCFLPNIAKSLSLFVDGIVHLWSIGVEEQFYLIWPFIILFFRKHLFIVLVVFFLGISILPFFIGFLNTHSNLFLDNKILFERLLSFVEHFKINAMSIGGIIAYIYYNQKNWLNWLFKYYIGEFLVLITFALWFYGFQLYTISDEFYAILFSLIIYKVVINDKPLIKLFDNRIVNYLGEISYGLYVYHWLVLQTVINFVKRYIVNFEHEMIKVNLIIYIGTIFFTILISHFSYQYFEKFFLKYKRN
jgi:peptidoglycan/LPS O-acetylase OafA/YrhL